MPRPKRIGPKPPAFIINKQPIPGAIWGRVVKYCHGDRYSAATMMYRARKADDIIRYLSNGMKEGTINNFRIEEENSQHKDAWIRHVIFKEKPKPQPVVTTHEGPASLGNILSGLFINCENGI